MAKKNFNQEHYRKLRKHYFVGKTKASMAESIGVDASYITQCVLGTKPLTLSLHNKLLMYALNYHESDGMLLDKLSQKSALSIKDRK